MARANVRRASDNARNEYFKKVTKEALFQGDQVPVGDRVLWTTLYAAEHPESAGMPFEKGDEVVCALSSSMWANIHEVPPPERLIFQVLQADYPFHMFMLFKERKRGAKADDFMERVEAAVCAVTELMYDQFHLEEVIQVQHACLPECLSWEVASQVCMTGECVR